MNKVTKAQRKAYGKILVQFFLFLSSATNYMLNYPVTFGTEIMTDEEKELHQKLTAKLNKDADVLRTFGKRLEK